MEITNGTGQHKVREKEENKARIKKWFDNNKGATKKECANSLRLSYPTVLNLVKEIESSDI